MWSGTFLRWTDRRLTPVTIFSVRILRLAVLVTVVGAACGDQTPSASPNTNPASGAGSAAVLMLPTSVAPGLTLRTGCLEKGVERPGFAVLAYRGDGRYRTEQSSESALLRVFTYDLEAGLVPDDPDFDSLDDVLATADPGSVTETSLRGQKGYAYRNTTAEPYPAPWPAVAWQEGSVIIWLLGEGLTEKIVNETAESLKPVAEQEWVSVVGERGCRVEDAPATLPPGSTTTTSTLTPRRPTTVP